jgi:hypothetical protein
MRLYLLIGIILAACNSKQSQIESTSSQTDEIRKMILEDTFDIDTGSVLTSGNLSDLNKKSLSELALKPLQPNYNLKNLSFENVEEVYLNMLKIMKKHTDSSEEKKDFLDSVFKELELENEKLQQIRDYPIEIKLKIASIKSDIHFLHSNRQLKPKT